MSEQHTFVTPSTQITSHADLEVFLRSPTCAGWIKFLEALNASVTNKKLSDETVTSPIIDKIVQILQRLAEWVDEIPPLKQPMRYGNKAYRTWFQRVQENSHELMLEILPENLSQAATELKVYFSNGWGNETRIDYGTGHETCFVAWMYCLYLSKLVTEEHFQSLVTRVFATYIATMRKIQRTYGLEPAGSHGVWSLDDYQFLPFYFGSAQLLDHPNIKPRSIRSFDILDTFASEYLYIDAIRFIHQVKTGPFAEHSPILNDIANVPTWSKVNLGLMKMYQVEVIGKFPIMQHFFFGSLIVFKQSNQSTPPATTAEPVNNN